MPFWLGGMNGPEPTLATMVNAAAQRHQISHSCVAQHFRRPNDGSAVQSEFQLQAHQRPLSELLSGYAVTPSESFHPGVQAMDSFSEPVRDEIHSLFPELKRNTDSYGPSARLSLKSCEAVVAAKELGLEKRLDADTSKMEYHQFP